VREEEGEKEREREGGTEREKERERERYFSGRGGSFDGWGTRGVVTEGPAGRALRKGEADGSFSSLSCFE